MLNQCVLVGRIKELKNDILTLAVSKSYKNEKGIYETNLIRINLVDNIGANVNEYCQKGDMVGIKARIETGNKIIAEKVSFLSSRSNK